MGPEPDRPVWVSLVPDLDLGVLVQDRQVWSRQEGSESRQESLGLRLVGLGLVPGGYCLSPPPRLDSPGVRPGLVCPSLGLDLGVLV